MSKIGLDLPRSTAVETMEEGLAAIEEVGFPAILRPAFTLGGTGGAVAYNMEEYKDLLENALDLSPVSQVLVEESVLGWKEYELEVMRDNADNVVIICSIENFDPMGVHTGDSITVAPAQTLTDKEYQRMRDASIDIIREIGVDTGGSNIQFALNPEDGRMTVIEMNPRVSRSSALASKATGFPIAKIAAKLAIGLTLDEIRNDITRETPASFEPAIDYVVTKIPRFAFEKFPEADPTLTTQMKSVGEVMSIGRTFKESLQKAIRSLEIDSSGFEERESDREELRERLKVPNSDRLWCIAESIREGMSIEEIYDVTKIDPWFLNNIREIIDFEADIATTGRKISKDPGLLLKAKSFGFSDRRIAELTGLKEADVRNARNRLGMRAVYKMVDTCAAEFEAYTPYLYSTYERPFYKIVDMLKDSRSERLSVETLIEIQGARGSSDKDDVHSDPGTLGSSNPVFECEANPSDRKKIMILGSGPNRIGQGIEFDYCCVHAVFSLKDEGFETIMVNCNPETVSTDYDTSDRLYFEPLTLEDVLNIIEVEKPEGVIVQFGGQTPLKLAVPLEKEGVRILGTPPDAIDRAEDRKRFKDLLHKLKLRQPESGTAMSSNEAVKVAGKIGYPAMVRPSYVLGGRAMEIVYDEESLKGYMERAMKVSPEHPVLIDKYIVDAIEVDVDAVCDGDDVIIGGVMEHIEAAGIHSGDSACSLPPYSLSPGIVDEIKVQTSALARELGVIGLMNIQFAVKDNDIYIIEVNPRASRTVPYVSKATGIPLAKVAARVMAGMKLKDIGLTSDPDIDYVAIKEAVFPFDKFSNVDTILGPEMKSTGEVMGIDTEFGIAYAKAESAARNQIPVEGKLFMSVRDEDKPRIPEIARTFIDQGFGVVATRGTAAYLQENGIDAEVINKLKEGRPNVVDLIKNKEISFIINTIESASAQADSFYIRQSALQYRVSYTTTMSGARAVATAVDRLKNVRLSVKSLQEYHAGIRSSVSSKS